MRSSSCCNRLTRASTHAAAATQAAAETGFTHLNPPGKRTTHSSGVAKVKAPTEPAFSHLNPPGKRATDSSGKVKPAASSAGVFVHLNPPGKRRTDGNGKVKAAGAGAAHQPRFEGEKDDDDAGTASSRPVTQPTAEATPPAADEIGAAATPPAADESEAAATPPAADEIGAAATPPAADESEAAAEAIERKLPWRKGTRDFHNHMNGRVHPRNNHPAEEADIRGKFIKTSERPTPFTGWGLPRDRYGRATEIGYGGGFHGAGHWPVVDSRTLPMGGTADRPWKASVDDPAPPSPRIWSWQGVTDPHEDAIDMRRHRRRGSFPDTPAQGWADDTEASWREQDPEEQDYSWQLGRGLGGRDEEPEDDEALGVH